MYKHFCFLEQNYWKILYDASTRKKNKALIFVNAKSMQWECFVAKIAINPWVVFLSLQRRCTKQLLVFIRVHKSLANGIWWVWVIIVIFFQILVFRYWSKTNIALQIYYFVCFTDYNGITINCSTYRKVASTNMPHIEPHPDIYRLLMQGKL